MGTYPAPSNTWAPEDGRSPTIDGSAPDHYTPAESTYLGRNYVFGFWSIVDQRATTFGFSPEGRIAATNREAGHTYDPGTWTVTAKAYYFWDFAGGGGENGAYIDAFDVNAGDFLPDDFVDVRPDPDGSLTFAANDDGVLNTSAIQKEEVIAARLGLRGVYGFMWWQVVDRLTYPPVGAPVRPTVVDNLITVHPNDIIVGVAMYGRFTPPVRPAFVYEYPAVFLQPSDAGLLPMPVFPHTPWPPGPPEPTGPLFAAMRLLDAARFVTGDARAELMSSAEKMALAAAEAIKREMGGK